MGRAPPKHVDPVPNDSLKLKVLLGASAWLLFITALHVQLNVGWARLGMELRVLVGQERGEMIVGFLPVT